MVFLLGLLVFYRELLTVSEITLLYSSLTYLEKTSGYRISFYVKYLNLYLPISATTKQQRHHFDKLLLNKKRLH